MGQSNHTTRIVGPTGTAATVTTAGKLNVAVATTTAFGALQVTTDPTIVFTDTFEGVVFDTVNRWNTYGSVAAVQSQGRLSLDPSTTANATTTVSSQPLMVINMPIIVAGLMTLESGTVATGIHRFFGLGTAPSNVGTAAAPLTDAVGFEIDTSGVLRASVYNTGVRVFTQALTIPTDGQPHIYFMQLRGDVCFFHLDDTVNPVAFTMIGSASQYLPFRLHRLNSATVTGTGVMTLSSFSVLDVARQATALADGAYPWRRVTIDTAGALLTSTRTSDNLVTAVGAASAAVTCTLPAAGAGLFHYVTDIAVTRYATNNIAGTATPVTVTTTNLPGSLAWTGPTTASTGTVDRITEDLSSPMKSSAANTATTVVCPATTNIIWRITVHYYIGT